MDVETLRENWGLAVAAGLVVAVCLTIAVTLYGRSSRAQLRQRVKQLREANRKHGKARAAVESAERRLAKLISRGESTKPRLVEEGRAALGDAKALEKIAHDQVLIAANHLRRVIYEEFPPKRHERLRQKYLPGDTGDERPFSF